MERLADIEILLCLGVRRLASQRTVADLTDLGVRAIGGEAIFDLVQPRKSCLNRS